MSLSEAFDQYLLDELEKYLMEEWEKEEKEGKINYHPEQPKKKRGRGKAS